MCLTFEFTAFETVKNLYTISVFFVHNSCTQILGWFTVYKSKGRSMEILRRCRARIKHFGENQKEMDRKYVTLVRKGQIDEPMQSQRRKVMEFIREGDKEKLEEYLKVFEQNLHTHLSHANVKHSMNTHPISFWKKNPFSFLFLGFPKIRHKCEGYQGSISPAGGCCEPR